MVLTQRILTTPITFDHVELDMNYQTPPIHKRGKFSYPKRQDMVNKKEIETTIDNPKQAPAGDTQLIMHKFRKKKKKSRQYRHKSHKSNYLIRISQDP